MGVFVGCDQMNRNLLITALIVVLIIFIFYPKSEPKIEDFENNTEENKTPVNPLYLDLTIEEREGVFILTSKVMNGSTNGEIALAVKKPGKGGHSEFDKIECENMSYCEGSVNYIINGTGNHSFMAVAMELSEPFRNAYANESRMIN